MPQFSHAMLVKGIGIWRSEIRFVLNQTFLFTIYSPVLFEVHVNIRLMISVFIYFLFNMTVSVSICSPLNGTTRSE